MTLGKRPWLHRPSHDDLKKFSGRVLLTRPVRATTEGPMGVPLYQAKAEFFRTLGHPARIRILELLAERDHAVHELLDRIAIEPSNLSQQLAVLRRTSLVVSHRRAGEVIYSISEPEVRDLLLAARKILVGLAEAQRDFEDELVVKVVRTPPVR